MHLFYVQELSLKLYNITFFFLNDIAVVREAFKKKTYLIALIAG
jgi:hypothetical protein